MITNRVLTRRIVLTLALFLVSGLVAQGCTPPPPEMKEFVCTPVEQADRAEDPTATPYYIADEVIVIGPADEITPVVSEVSDKLGIPLVLVEDCDLRYLSTFTRNVNLEFPFPSKRADKAMTQAIKLLEPDRKTDLSMRLYWIPGVTDPEQSPVPQVVTAINAEGKEHNVFADPNYLTGPLEGNTSSCGTPYEVGGSPYEVGGSPYEVGGSPVKGPKPMTQTPATDQFQNQWAFSNIDADQYFNSRNYRGQNVRVGVFDTSPFTETSPEDTSFSKEIDWAWPYTLTLTVWHRNLGSIQAPAPPAGEGEIVVDVRDHGLFVAGLIHSIAPSSEIHLFRVLDQNGCGNLHTLNKALHRFNSEKQSQAGTLDRIVVNLSLGVHQQPPDPGAEDLPSDVVSLEVALLEMFSRGAVVVAAAGNDSDQNQALSMHLPADYPFVIGVASSNEQDSRSCFSNRGDVSAPGGEGGIWPDCMPVVYSCDTEPSYCVISLVRNPELSSTGYAYWSGTSFSTPLVSGLAALILEASPSSLPFSVATAIDHGAAATGDIINIPGTVPTPTPVP